MGCIGVITHFLAIDPNFQRGIQVMPGSFNRPPFFSRVGGDEFYNMLKKLRVDHHPAGWFPTIFKKIVVATTYREIIYLHSLKLTVRP